MAPGSVKKAGIGGLVGLVAVLVPLGIQVSNEVQDWVRQLDLMEKERALKMVGPPAPGSSLEERVDSLEAFHAGGN